jgi:hypothetical protein
MTGTEIVQQAREQLAQMTGLKPDAVSAFTKDEEGWHISVEMIELKRIPEASDILATYDVNLDDKGNLLRYQRTRRYLRSEVGEQET